MISALQRSSAVLVLLVLSACGNASPRTEILLRVTADESVKTSLAQMRIRIAPTVGATPTFEHQEPAASLAWPVELGIIPSQGDASRSFHIEVSALDGQGRSLVAVRRSTRFLAGQTRVLTVHLASSCLGVPTCSDMQSCERGSCVPTPVIDPETLPGIEQGASDGGMDGQVRRDGNVEGGAGDPDASLPADGGAEGGVDSGSPDSCTLLPFYRDDDGDGFGDPSTMVAECGMPDGFVDNGSDCDDACQACTPSGTETCDGVRDEDCDGTVDDGCACTEGASRPCPGGIETGACEAGSQRCVGGAWSACIGNVDPVLEDCDNVDDDCDGMVDDNVTRPCGMDVGACRVGVERCSAGTFIGCTATMASPETCNGVDDDCDTVIDDGVQTTFYRDADGDTFGDPLVSVQACSAPAGYVSNNRDCSDSCMACRPGGTEMCEGSRDENCSGTVDEGCACVDGSMRACPGGSSVGICRPGMQLCSGGMWGACSGRVEAVPETCNAMDDDCDGAVDDMVTRACGPTMTVGICMQGTQTCSAGAFGTCVGAVNPGTETCNGLDDDCDSRTDEGVLMPFFIDADRDGYGVAGSRMDACTAPAGYAAMAGDCADASASTYPGAREMCNGLDENCNGEIDDDADCPVPTTCTAMGRISPRTMYLVCSSRRTFQGASDACRSFLDGNGRRFQLASVLDAAEQTFVDGLAPVGETFWIGLEDRGREGVYQWADGTALGTTRFENFATGEPNNMGTMSTRDGDCVRILGDNGTWFDEDCSVGISFICEQR